MPTSKPSSWIHRKNSQTRPRAGARSPGCRPGPLTLAGGHRNLPAGGGAINGCLMDACRHRTCCPHAGSDRGDLQPVRICLQRWAHRRSMRAGPAPLLLPCGLPHSRRSSKTRPCQAGSAARRPPPMAANLCRSLRKRQKPTPLGVIREACSDAHFPVAGTGYLICYRLTHSCLPT